MKKDMKLSLIVVLVLVMGGIGVLIKFQKKRLIRKTLLKLL